jgi:hypothetical protein
MQISIRVPPEALRRAEALRSKIARNRTVLALGKVTRSTVLKLAMMRGLDVLESEHK